MTKMTKLNEFDADEWFDGACRLRRITREEFDELWERFQREKAARRAH
jgi:hypothetical protein